MATASVSALTMLTMQGRCGRSDRQVRPSFRVVKITGSPCTTFSQRPVWFLWGASVVVHAQYSKSV